MDIMKFKRVNVTYLKTHKQTVHAVPRRLIPMTSELTMR